MATTRKIEPASGTINVESVRVQRHDYAHYSTPVELVAHPLSAPVSQGRCGACWAISTTQVLRDRINRERTHPRHKLAPIPELSAQFVTDCCKTCVEYRGRVGCAIKCGGGFLVSGFHCLRTTGTPREGYHPSRAHGSSQAHLDGTADTAGKCPDRVDASEPLYRCADYYTVNLYPDMFGITNGRDRGPRYTPEQLRRNEHNILIEIAEHGPVAVCFNMFSDFRPFWNHPNSGNMVYEIGWQLFKADREAIDPVGDPKWTKQSGPHGIHLKLGHSVSIVGWGVQQTPDGPVDYWLCRNSWGQPSNTATAHGVHGYFKIRRGVNCSGIGGDVAACALEPLAALAAPCTVTADADADADAADADAAEAYCTAMSRPTPAGGDLCGWKWAAVLVALALLLAAAIYLS